MSQKFRMVALAVAGLALVACRRSSDEPTEESVVPAAAGVPGVQVPGNPTGLGEKTPSLWADDFRLGDPIAGLSQAERDAFDRGRLVFERRFKPSEGLGAFYNATSCVTCHSTPVPGGSAQLYRNFYLAMAGTPPFQFPLLQLSNPVVPAFGSGPHSTFATFTLEGERVAIPETSQGFDVTVAQRNAIPIFGTGLFEFVVDATILANADPNDGDGDGISGRFNTDAGALGRFGTKAQSNNIEIFTRAPLFNQMGITSEPFLGSAGLVHLSAAGPFQGTFDPDAPILDNDNVPDPEMSTQDLGDLIAFSRFLAPPRRKFPPGPDAHLGEVLFEQVGCTDCHLPVLPSTRGPLHAYTDLLLHDMGPELADGLNLGSPQAASGDPPHTGSEWRTQPLWGVSMHAPFLHDGRAETLEEAVLMHGGEAQAARDGFAALSAPERARIIAFLESL